MLPSARETACRRSAGTDRAAGEGEADLAVVIVNYNAGDYLAHWIAVGKGADAGFKQAVANVETTLKPFAVVQAITAPRARIARMRFC